MDPEQIDDQYVLRLLERAFGGAAALLAAVPAGSWDAGSPCTGWTVRQVGDHLVGGLSLIDRYAREEPVAEAEADADATAGLDALGDDPAKAFTEVAERCVATFSAFGALGRQVPFVIGPAPGHVLARVCLLEALVHGWDIAQGAGMPFDVDDAVVETAAAFIQGPIGEQSRAAGRFGPELPARPDDSTFAGLLAYLGRRA